MEHILVRNSVIKSAQVYYTLDGYFHVEITQRKPVLRIMSGEGYYVVKMVKSCRCPGNIRRA